MKFIVVSTFVHPEPYGPQSVVFVFDTYTEARRSLAGIRSNGKVITQGSTLHKKYPQMPRNVVRKLMFEDNLSVSHLNPPIAVFKEYGGRYTHTIHISNK